MLSTLVEHSFTLTKSVSKVLLGILQLLPVRKKAWLSALQHAANKGIAAYLTHGLSNFCNLATSFFTWLLCQLGTIWDELPDQLRPCSLLVSWVISFGKCRQQWRGWSWLKPKVCKEKGLRGRAGWKKLNVSETGRGWGNLIHCLVSCLACFKDFQSIKRKLRKSTSLVSFLFFFLQLLMLCLERKRHPATFLLIGTRLKPSVGWPPVWYLTRKSRFPGQQTYGSDWMLRPNVCMDGYKSMECRTCETISWIIPCNSIVHPKMIWSVWIIHWAKRAPGSIRQPPVSLESFLAFCWRSSRCSLTRISFFRRRFRACLGVAHSGRGQPYLMYRFYHLLLSVWPPPLIAFAWIEDIEDLLT